VLARITLGKQTFRTKTYDNVGGNQVFNEKLTFMSAKTDITLKVGQTANNHPPAFL
jgi:hypothetical protein